MGHVYLVGNYKKDGTYKIKIGRTNNPVARIKQLQTGSMDTLIYHTCNEVGDAKTIEKSFHTLLQEYKIKGEWYSIPSDKVYALAKILHTLDKDCLCDGCTCVTTQKILAREM